MARFVLIAAALAAPLACYAPTPRDCAYTCLKDSDCPESQTCQVLQRVCRSAGQTGACAGPPLDAGPVPSPEAAVDASRCTLAPAYAPVFSPSTQGAKVGPPSMGSTVVVWEGLVDMPTLTVLEIQTLSGQPTDPDWPVQLGPVPHTISLPATDLQVALVPAAVTTTPTDFYLATSGGVDITSAGSNVGDLFAGDVVNLQFIHVDQNGQIIDGCTSSIASASFATPLSGM